MSRLASQDAHNHVSDWSLAVLRTTGLQFKPPEKSWRPSVHLFIPERPNLNAPPLVLGRDGQIQNARTTSLMLHSVDHRSTVSIRLMHGTQKRKAKQHLVASACLSLGELAERQRRQKRAGDPLSVRLSLPEPKERSPTVSYTGDVCLIVRLHVPPDYWETVAARLSSDEQETSSEREEAPPSDPYLEDSETDVDESMLKPPDIKLTGDRPDFSDSHSTSNGHASSLRRAFVYPPTPMQHPVLSDNTAIPAQRLSREASEDAHSEGGKQPEVSFTRPERLLSTFTPYAELSDAEHLPEDQRDERIEKALKLMQKEWSFAAASLLALAGINAAIFGLAPGTVFPIDGPARRVSVLGAITAGLGLFLDSLIVFSYYNADARMFRRIATGVDGTYFYFCVCSRVPTMCMLASATCLAAFLLIVAWAEWRSAVIVLSLLAGVAMSLQFFVYGFQQTLECAGWCMRGVRRELQVGSSAGTT